MVLDLLFVGKVNHMSVSAPKTRTENSCKWPVIPCLYLYRSESSYSRTSSDVSYTLYSIRFEPSAGPGDIYAQGHLVARNDWLKICANICSGVQFGVGVAFERTCTRLECNKCTGSPFDRD